VFGYNNWAKSVLSISLDTVASANTLGVDNTQIDSNNSYQFVDSQKNTIKLVQNSISNSMNASIGSFPYPDGFSFNSSYTDYKVTGSTANGYTKSNGDDVYGQAHNFSILAGVTVGTIASVLVAYVMAGAVTLAVVVCAVKGSLVSSLTSAVLPRNISMTEKIVTKYALWLGMVNDWTFYAQKNQTYLRITNTYSASETLRLYKVT